MNPIQYKTNKVSKKRVYYEGTDTLLEGYLLCYNWDVATDMDGDAVAEGSQCNGKYLKVEKPTTTNAKFVAGVVAEESSGKTGPCQITIIELSEAIIPVYSNADATGNSTTLYVTNGSYLGTTSGAYTIGIAMETVDRSGINGLILVKPRAVPATTQAVSDSLLSIETLLKSDLVVANTAIDSVETAQSSNAAVVQSHLTFRANSINTSFVSNDTTVQSHLTFRADSLNTAMNSNDTTLQSHVAALDSETTVVASAAKSLGSNAKVAASDLDTMMSDDINFSDLSVLASDLRNVLVNVISNLAVDISNFAVRVSDKLT